MDEATDIRQGDCREVMSAMPDCSVDAIVTDPPYGLSFMGKGWDHGVPGVEFWTEALRVAKPGAHLLAFGGTRTYHRLACAIEDAGWEIRDCVMWVYGSGFPKSLNVGKAIGKAAGAEREVVGYWKPTGTARPSNGGSHSCAKTTADCGYDPDTEALVPITAPATDLAKQWAGWGTALKPAVEPIILARKPLIGNVAENVLRHGTGGINVEACRVGTRGETPTGSGNGSKNSIYSQVSSSGGNNGNVTPPAGRWPANLIHDGSDEVVGVFPKQKSPAPYIQQSQSVGMYGAEKHHDRPSTHHGDSGSAARFFQVCPPDDARSIIYTAKASKRDRDEGCEGMEKRQKVFNGQSDHSAGIASGSVEDKFTTSPARNFHPTVKPTSLMRYLCRLITPPGGVVLDPFCGSGSTGKGAVLEGFRFIGIEREPEYVNIARARIAHAIRQVEEKDQEQEKLF